jgi:hypothetical protein
VATLINHVNNTLRLIGEQPLLNTVGTLGDLCKQALDEALITVVQETRHTSFSQLLSFSATNPDYLQPAFSLPSRLTQIDCLYFVAPNSTPSRLVKLVPGALETLYNNYRFCVVGQQVFVGNVLQRPASFRLKGWVAPVLPALDTDVLTIESDVAPVFEAVAAATLATSYLDDLSQQATLTKRAQELVQRLRTRAGATRDTIRFR